MARLILGDCLAALRDLPDDSVDGVVTDPPYGMGKDYGNSSDKEANALALVEAVMPELFRVMRGTVNTSTTTALGPMPATVTTVWYDGGTETKRLVSTIEYSTEKPTAKDFDRDWKEGALIRDNITRQLGKWHNGQFVVDQASTDLFNRPFSPWTPLFLGGVAAVFFVGTGFAVRRVARRRRSPGAVKS